MSALGLIVLLKEKDTFALRSGKQASWMYRAPRIWPSGRTSTAHRETMAVKKLQQHKGMEMGTGPRVRETILA